MSVDGRKLRILAAITNTYLQTGEPVGSKLVSGLLDGEVSSATVRNDMATLFEMGLLEQPHTSAGRIPSHLGLRIYLDRVMVTSPPTAEELQRVDAFFNSRTPDPERILEEAANALAEYTGCATISTTIYRQSASVRKIELIPATEHTVVILLIASNGMIKNKVCRVDFELNPRVVDFFTNYANSRLVNRSINQITAEYMQSVSITLGEYSNIFSPLLTAIYELCREVSESKVYNGGTSNLLEYSELRSVANHLFRVLGNREDIMMLIERDLSPLGVCIGRENTLMELSDSTVIISRYKIGEDSLGAIGLIGPVRMNYSHLIPYLEYFSQSLGKLINNTLQEQ